MLTQCTACLEWFHVEPGELDVAYGLVRCGRCGSVFDARIKLRETSPGLSGGAAGEEAEGPLPALQAVTGEEAVREELTASLSEPAPRAGRKRWWALWWPALAIALLALAVQLVHANRYAVVRTPGLGPVAASIYQALGHPLEPRLELARYAIVGASLNGVSRNERMLELTGRLVNRAGFVQRLPLLRLSLSNRYGQVVGSRMLLPSDYGAATISDLSAGRGLTFHLTLVDPGANATGFKLVLCKRLKGDVVCISG
ncbi:MAG: zinc-ribbon and DUF3426 domain-containing protein [Gammaproteobacteria bacterium]|nr:zinc-ribbon and DUF3426 domain-containing protein [Gammaproteobacteria bacterium]